MADLFDYLTWRGDLPFEQVKPNEVDCLIFSALSYLNFRDIVPGGFQEPVTLAAAAAAMEQQEDAGDRARVKNDLKLLSAAAASRRFGPVELCYYQSEFLPEQESQFAAVTFLLPENLSVLAFRGTDNTLVGWKEDFNMSFQARVPAQEKARYYTDAFAAVHSGPMILCGHSKGGNLAVYAAAMCRSELRCRIAGCCNYDGPGFGHEMLCAEGYQAVLPKLHTYVPESSVIGMLLEHEEPYRVVKSRQVSIMQHELYSWEVLGGGFVETDQVDADAQHFNLAVKTWLAGKTMRERNEFVDAVYELLRQGEVEKTSDLILPRNVLNYLRTLSTDEEMRAMIRGEFLSFAQSILRIRRRGDAPALGSGK